MINISTPDQCMSAIKEQIAKQEKTAFLSAVVLGLMTHAYAFFNKLYNYDELANTPGGFLAAGNNRWFYEIMGRFSGKVMGGSYSLPFFYGTVSILFLSVSALLIVRMFQVKSTILAGCIGGILVTFPAVTCMFYFMYLSPYFSVGIFLSILAAYLVIRHPKNRWCNIAAVVALACSTGTYQAYFPDTVCLFVISIILLCAFGGEEWKIKEIILLAVRYIIVLALGMILYFILNKFLMTYWDASVALGSYQGMDTMGQITVSELLDAVKRCYESFFALGTRGVSHVNERAVMMKGFRLVLLLFIISVICLICVKKGDWDKKALMFSGFIIFPIALFLPYVMAPKASYYTLMGYAVVFWLIFLAVWADYFYQKMRGVKLIPSGFQWLTSVILAMFCILYIGYGNGCYMALEYTKMHDMLYFQTMVTQIKSVEGYTDNMPLAVIGNNIDDETNSAGSLLGGTFSLDGRAESNVNGTAGIYLISKYLGYNPQFCTYEELKEWVEREEVKEMPCYPQEGSIQVIEGTVIVKLSEE